MLLNQELFDKALLQPIRDGADTLLVVAGYASPEMASRLLTEARGIRRSISIELIVGMVGLEGIPEDSHTGFLNVQDTPPGGSLQVSYTTGGRSVHSKVYIWLKEGSTVAAFAGSANFTQNGFLIGSRRERHSEVLVSVDPDEALAEFRRIEADSISIDHPDVLDEVTLYSRTMPPAWSVGSSDTLVSEEREGLESVVLPLIQLSGGGRGQVHRRSGLNWGQRPEAGRNPNQAYLPVPIEVIRTEFFPPRSVQFTVATDDNKTMIMSVAQDNGKALHTPQGNQLLGEYFRNRLGLAEGAPVTVEDLTRYGSRFVKFIRQDDGDYLMQFAPEVEAEGAAIYGI